MSALRELTVVAVHAHPDDEALWTGGLLALLAAAGAQVHVVTCTLGEQGEIIGQGLEHLIADDSDQLGGFRIHELWASLKLLGVRGHFLGHASAWRDSGMVGDPANEHPQAFIHSGDRAVADLVELLEDIQPNLLITYGPDGGYGHPDHIRAHEITTAAAAQLGIAEVLWAVTDATELAQGLQAITQVPQGWRAAEPGEIACVETTDLAFELDDAAYEAKKDAMRAHATQLWIADGSTSQTNPQAAFAAVADVAAAPAVFALSNLIAQPLLRREHYQFAPSWPQESRTPQAVTHEGLQALLAAGLAGK